MLQPKYLLIITLSNMTSILKECRNGEHGKTVTTEEGGYSAHQNAEIKSFATGDST